MSRSRGLIVQQRESMICLEEPAELFLGLPSLKLQEELSKSGSFRLAQQFAFTEEQNDGRAEDTSSDAQPADRDHPVVHLQENATERYCLRQSTINAGVRSFRQLTLEQMKQSWQALRLNTDARLKDERLFLVHCIDLCMLCWCRVDEQLQPLGEAHIVQRDTQGLILVQQKQELSERTLQAVETAACRALYALWLDIGSVLVAVSGTGKIAIRNAWSIESGASELPLQPQRDLLNSALTNWLDNWQADGDQPIYIGADPELIMLDKHHKLVMASELLLDHTHEEIGIDSLLYKGQILYPIVELRPHPVSHPAQLVSSIHRILKQLDHLIDGRELRLLAGAMPVKGIALGGHLHLSGVSLTPRLLRLLDVMLALPFAALADERGKLRNTKFGGLGDYRKQFHGGFEYRTLPSWLVSPALTQAAIYTCWLAVQEQARLVDKLESYDHFQRDVQHYGQGTREEQCALAQSFIDLLIETADDRGLAERLRPLQRALNKRASWNEQQDIRIRWQLTKAATP